MHEMIPVRFSRGDFFIYQYEFCSAYAIISFQEIVPSDFGKGETIRMRLKKVFLQGKKNEMSCEDGYVFCDHYAAVIDGVTSKSEHLFSGKTPGRIGMKVLCREIPLLDAELTVEQTVRKLTLALRTEREAMSREHEITLLEYPRACAAIYSKARREIWLIGDCQCRVNEKVYTNTKKVDDVMSHLRSFVLQCQLLSSGDEPEFETDDPGRRAILPFLKQQSLFENRDCLFGYPVLNGEAIVESQLVVIPVAKGSLVTLATDGYPVLHESFDESESALRDLLREDPMCYQKNLQTKGIQAGNLSFDDRCFLQFTT